MGGNRPRREEKSQGSRGNGARGRGAQRGRGPQGRWQGNKESVQKKTAETTVPVQKKEPNGDWQQNRPKRPTNPAFNPSWGSKAVKAPPSIAEPTWAKSQVPVVKPETKQSDWPQKEKTSSKWAKTEETVPAPKQQWPAAVQPATTSWGESTASPAAAWDAQQPTAKSTEAENNWTPKEEAIIPQQRQQQPKAQPRPRKKQEPIGGLRVSRNFTGQSKQVWRKKESSEVKTETREASKPESKILESTQTEMSKLSVATGPSHSNEPDVSLPFEVTSEVNSMVHFGLNKDSSTQQNSRSQFGSDLFGVNSEDRTIRSQGSRQFPSTQSQLRQDKTTTPAPEVQPQIQQSAPTTTTTVQTETPANTAPESSPSTQPTNISQQPNNTNKAPSQAQNVGGRPSVGEQGVVYTTPHGYPNAHPQYAMPNGDNRTFSSPMGYENPAPMHYYPQEFVQQGQRFQQQHGRNNNRAHKGGKPNKGVESAKDSKNQQGNETSKRGKQQRYNNAPKGRQYGMKQQNFKQGNFQKPRQQNMQPQYSQQQHYAMNPVQYPYPMHYGYQSMPHYAYQNPPFNPQAYGRTYFPNPGYTYPPGAYQNQQSPAGYEEQPQPQGQQPQQQQPQQQFSNESKGYQQHPAQGRNQAPQGLPQREVPQNGFNQAMPQNVDQSKQPSVDQGRQEQVQRNAFPSSGWNSAMPGQNSQPATKIDKPVGNLMGNQGGYRQPQSANFYSMPQQGSFQTDPQGQQGQQTQQVQQSYPSWSA